MFFSPLLLLFRLSCLVLTSAPYTKWGDNNSTGNNNNFTELRFPFVYDLFVAKFSIKR